MKPFNKNTIHQFGFVRAKLDLITAEVQLNYRLDQFEVQERIVFPQPIPELSAIRKEAVDRVLKLLHFVAGVSYYKAALPTEICFDEGAPSPSWAQFLHKVYRHGLGEFAHVNQLELDGLCQFSASNVEYSPLDDLQSKDRVLTPIGGGKDSLVTIEALREAGVEQSLIQLGNAELIKNVIRATGLPSLRISRTIDPQLIQWNKEGAWNGHVPITAILSIIMVLAALLYDFKAVVMSNEASASSANLVNDKGEEVNHQYSKSWEFEQDLNAILIQAIGPGVQYFSALRNLSEISILEKFSQYPQYFHEFSSCNRNFHIGGAKIEGRWCGDCPKCRFIFLCLAPFVSKVELLNIFGKNMLDDLTQLEGFAELAGLSGHKPFECVGEVEESRAALFALLEHHEWKQSPVISALTAQLNQHDFIDLQKLLLTSGSVRRDANA